MVTGENKIVLDDFPIPGKYNIYDGSDLITDKSWGTNGNWICEAEFKIYNTFPTVRKNLTIGDTIGWNIWYDDSDDETRENGTYVRDHQVGWLYSGKAYQNADYFGDIILGDFPNFPPDEPILLEPKNNEFMNNNRPQLIWNVPSDKNHDSLHFKLEIAYDSSFANQIFGSPFESHSNTLGFNPTPPVMEGTNTCSFIPLIDFTDSEYWWRITAWDGFEYGNVSSPQKFTIDIFNPTIVQIEPLDTGYGNNWYNQDSSSIVKVKVYYSEINAKTCSLDVEETTFRLVQDIPSGENQSTQFNFEHISTIKDGRYVLQATIIDKAGNSSSDTTLLNFDSSPPKGTIAHSPDTSTSKLFTVSWGEGNDGNGSGLSGIYDVKVKIDDNSWTNWKTKFIGTSDNYVGDHGHKYSFEALAWDNLGNREDSTGIAESQTIVDITAPDNQPPSAPGYLIANGDNPSPWQTSNKFKTTWVPPFDPSGIARSLYKLGSEPTDDYDTTGTTAASPPLNITATQESGQMFYLWLEDGRGNINFQNYSSVNLRYDATPPDVDIISPHYRDMISEKVYIWATIADINIDRYLLQFKMEFQNEWQYLLQRTINHSIQDSLLWLWENSSDSGDVYLKMTAWDKLNHFSADSVLFILDNRNPKVPFAKILSPSNKNYIHGWVEVIGYAADEDPIRYFLSLKRQNLDTLLTENDIKKANDILFVLDTEAFPDGEYSLILRVKDSKQYENSDSIKIIIDNTPPVANLICPETGDTINCFVQIQWEAEEENLKSIALKYADHTETDASKFIPIDTTTFGCWNTMDLNGSYNLYLIVEDQGGLKSIDQHTYYIDNPFFDQRTGLQRCCAEFSLYIPPNGYKYSVICLAKRDFSEFNIPDSLKPIDLVCEIHSSIEEEEIEFSKPAVFTIDYSTVDLANFNEDSLCIFNYQCNKWNLIGGTINKQNSTITTTIDQIGIYGLFENTIRPPGTTRELNINFQPRIFSPKSGRHDSQTAISFELGSGSNVTIKIYNPAGRLVKALIENERMPHGNNVVYWNGKDQQGEFCVSGLYIVTIQAEEKMATKTVVILNK